MKFCSCGRRMRAIQYIAKVIFRPSPDTTVEKEAPQVCHACPYCDLVKTWPERR